MGGVWSGPGVKADDHLIMRDPAVARHVAVLWEEGQLERLLAVRCVQQHYRLAADHLPIERNRSQFKNNCFAEMWSGFEEGSYLDWCGTQL